MKAKLRNRQGVAHAIFVWVRPAFGVRNRRGRNKTTFPKTQTNGATKSSTNSPKIYRRRRSVCDLTQKIQRVGAMARLSGEWPVGSPSYMEIWLSSGETFLQGRTFADRNGLRSQHVISSHRREGSRADSLATSGDPLFQYSMQTS